MNDSQTVFALVPFLLLWLAIPLLWLSAARWLWSIPFAASLLAGLGTGLLSPPSLLFIAALAVACYLSGNKSGPLGASARLMVICMALAAAFHAVPGINNLLIREGLAVADSAMPFDLYWNYDKAITGFLILAFCVPALAGQPSLRQLPTLIGAITLALCLTVMPLAIALGEVRWEPKIPPALIWWLPANLFITSLAEEAFFRGFIQHRLSAWLAPRLAYGPLLAVVATALIFGAAHAGGGINWVVLATLAGLGYGYAYHATGRIEAAILVHFGFNLAHILLLSYPRLDG